jgi:galactose mutarotase-like enzyme
VAHGKENVVIAAGDCGITILPGQGGKIASIRVGSHLLLHPPLHPYGPLNTTMGFEEGDAGGWDECLPSVAACSIATPAGTATVPDHGDLWRTPWQVLDATEDSVTMRARCFSLPLELTRSMILTTTDSGYKVEFLYSLTNVGSHRVPWSWAAHPLFVCAKGDRIVLPPEVTTLRLEGSRNNRLGKRGDSVAWPMARIADGTLRDLRQARADNADIGDKLFAGQFTGQLSGLGLSDWCALERASIGLRITLRFDTTLTPCLGLWVCYGGWPEGDGPKQVCIALEPTTAPVDSLAETGEWTRWLEAGETVNWPMTLEIDRMAAPEETES